MQKFDVKFQRCVVYQIEALHISEELSNILCFQVENIASFLTSSFLLETTPQYYPAHASPSWEFSKTVFTSRADMDRLGWKRDRNEEEEDASNNGNN